MIASRASSSGGHAAAAAITHPESISVMRQGSTNELPFRVDDGRVHLAVTLPEGGRGSRHNGFGVEHASVSHPVDRDGSASQEDTREDEERASAA